jgi:hypothetical protein
MGRVSAAFSRVFRDSFTVVLSIGGVLYSIGEHEGKARGTALASLVAGGDPFPAVALVP